ncbi:MAG: ImmA/IrrE family metallo-endopeptidase [Gammaproteobacteria bacterium]
MDDFQVIMKARQFVRDAQISAVPVDLAQCAAGVNATIKVRHDLGDDESGQTCPIGDRHLIVLNGNHSDERQRFTALHEIAHIALGLPSRHGAETLRTETLFRYRRRPPEEVACDLFAAECLLPYTFFKSDAENEDPSLDAIRALAQKYKASLTATGLRFVNHTNVPSAFALIERGKVRYVAYSKHLRELSGWIAPGFAVPKQSVAHRVIMAGNGAQDYDELPTDTWFENSKIRHALICEESIYLEEWDQCLSLIWIDPSIKPSRNDLKEDAEEDEPLLRELDGTLPWPSKSRRR